MNILLKLKAYLIALNSLIYSDSAQFALHHDQPQILKTTGSQFEIQQLIQIGGYSKTLFVKRHEANLYIERSIQQCTNGNEIWKIISDLLTHQSRLTYLHDRQSEDHDRHLGFYSQPTEQGQKWLTVNGELVSCSSCWVRLMQKLQKHLKAHLITVSSDYLHYAEAFLNQTIIPPTNSNAVKDLRLLPK